MLKSDNIQFAQALSNERIVKNIFSFLLLEELYAIKRTCKVFAEYASLVQLDKYKRLFIPILVNTKHLKKLLSSKELEALEIENEKFKQNFKIFTYSQFLKTISLPLQSLKSNKTSDFYFAIIFNHEAKIKAYLNNVNKNIWNHGLSFIHAACNTFQFIIENEKYDKKFEPEITPIRKITEYPTYFSPFHLALFLKHFKTFNLLWDYCFSVKSYPLLKALNTLNFPLPKPIFPIDFIFRDVQYVNKLYDSDSKQLAMDINQLPLASLAAYNNRLDIIKKIYSHDPILFRYHYVNDKRLFNYCSPYMIAIRLNYKDIIHFFQIKFVVKMTKKIQLIQKFREFMLLAQYKSEYRFQSLQITLQQIFDFSDKNIALAFLISQPYLWPYSEALNLIFEYFDVANWDWGNWLYLEISSNLKQILVYAFINHQHEFIKSYLLFLKKVPDFFKYEINIGTFKPFMKNETAFKKMQLAYELMIELEIEPNFTLDSNLIISTLDQSLSLEKKVEIISEKLSKSETEFYPLDLFKVFHKIPNEDRDFIFSTLIKFDNKVLFFPDFTIVNNSILEKLIDCNSYIIFKYFFEKALSSELIKDFSLFVLKLIFKKMLVNTFYNSKDFVEHSQIIVFLGSINDEICLLIAEEIHSKKQAYVSEKPHAWLTLLLVVYFKRYQLVDDIKDKDYKFLLTSSKSNFEIFKCITQHDYLSIPIDILNKTFSNIYLMDERTLKLLPEYGVYDLLHILIHGYFSYLTNDSSNISAYSNFLFYFSKAFLWMTQYTPYSYLILNEKDLYSLADIFTDHVLGMRNSLDHAEAQKRVLFFKLFYESYTVIKKMFSLSEHVNFFYLYILLKLPLSEFKIICKVESIKFEFNFFKRCLDKSLSIKKLPTFELMVNYAIEQNQDEYSIEDWIQLLGEDFPSIKNFKNKNQMNMSESSNTEIEQRTGFIEGIDQLNPVNVEIKELDILSEPLAPGDPLFETQNDDKASVSNFHAIDSIKQLDSVVEELKKVKKEDDLQCLYDLDRFYKEKLLPYLKSRWFCQNKLRNVQKAYHMGLANLEHQSTLSSEEKCLKITFALLDILNAHRYGTFFARTEPPHSYSMLFNFIRQQPWAQNMPNRLCNTYILHEKQRQKKPLNFGL